LLVRPVVLRAPANFDVGKAGDMSRMLRYVALIRKNVLAGKQVMIDLEHCEYISPIACLLLAAEVERCNALKPGFIYGNEPLSEEARAALDILGFYEAIGIEPPHDPPDGVAQIASGIGSGADNAQKLARIAELARETWGDQAFADRVHGALNEAITNVIMHAYDPGLITHADPCVPGKWWVAGFAVAGEAWFLALDQGVGIPTSAPAKNRGVFNYLAQLPKVADSDVIHSVVANEGRSRTGLPNHGKGIPSMMALIEDRAETGAVLILSGSGGFLLEKRPRNGPLPARTFELKISLSEPLSGTLIVWKVGTPILTPSPEGRL
jgi:hypothetical protein